MSSIFRSHARAGKALSGAVFYRAAIVVFLALTSASLIGAGPAHAQSYRFSSFSVEGNSTIPAGTILSHAGIASGHAVSAAQLNAAYQRVLRTGLFESVDFIPRGGRLVIRVKEFPLINRVSIEGNARISDEKAMKIIKARPRLVFSPSAIEQDAAALTEAYRAQGRLAATVTPKVIKRRNNRVDVVFEVHEGRVVEVERLSFVGNRAYSDWRLRQVLRTKQAGALRALIQRDTFNQDRLLLDRSLLTDFYHARGYVDFQILSVANEFSRERNAFFLTYKLREGQQFRIGKTSVSSEVPGVDATDFERLGHIRSGRVYSPETVDNVIARMERLALRKGLNMVRVDPRVSRNDRDQTLDIEFALVEGPRIFVERIDIGGNATTLDRVIRRQFKIAEGDPFNPREIREGAARIRALGLFSATQVQAHEGSASDKVVVDVNVEESKTGSLKFGVAYNFSRGFGLTMKFSERNFMGRGQKLKFDIQIGLDNANGGITFVEPAFLGRDVAFRFDGEYRQTNYSYTKYNTKKLLVRPSFTFPIGENTRLGLRYTLARNQLLKVDPGSSTVLMAEEARGGALTNGIGYTLSYDTRNRGLNPDAGVLMRFGQDYSVGSGVRYLKTTATLAGEARIWNGNLKLRGTLEGGMVNSFGGVSGLNDRFFLTSANLRGYAPAGLGPRDLTVANQDALGGNYYAAARFETEFPLGLPEELGITGGVFYDIGSVWGLDNNNGGAIDDTMHLRSSAGISVFWKTPLGPLRFNFSRALQHESYDKVQNFDLTFSTEF